MFKIVQGVITLLILASLILQILVILGNFSGLRNVNIIRVELNNPESTGGFFGGLIDSINNKIDSGLPDYLTMALLVICEGNTGSNNATTTNCSPPSFGFRYTSTGTLDTLQKQIPSTIQSLFSGVQKGIFIPSVVLCFVLLCYNFYHQYTGHKANHHFGCCQIFLILTIAFIAFLFSIATFVVQIVAYNLVKDGVSKTKGSIFGGLLSKAVDINTKTGASIWMSLAAFICLFLVSTLLVFSVCCFNSHRDEEGGRGRSRFGLRRRRRHDESYEMGRRV